MTMASQAPIFKFDVCMYKNENISTEDFTKYMTETYPAKAAPVMQRNGVLQFAVTLTPPAYREPNRDSIKNRLKEPEWTVPDYDAVISYWLRDPADMGKVTADPGMAELEKDAPGILNHRLGHLVMGHQTVLFTTEAIPKPMFPASDA